MAENWPENRDKNLEAKDPLVEQLKALSEKTKNPDTQKKFAEQAWKTPAANRAEQLKLDQLQAAMLAPDWQWTQLQPERTKDQIQKDYEDDLKQRSLSRQKWLEWKSTEQVAGWWNKMDTIKVDLSKEFSISELKWTQQWRELLTKIVQNLPNFRADRIDQVNSSNGLAELNQAIKNIPWSERAKIRQDIQANRKPSYRA